MEEGKAVGVELSVCEHVDDNSRVDSDFDVATIHVLPDSERLVVLVMIAVIMLKKSAALDQLARDLFVLGMELQGEGIKVFDLHGSRERAYQMLGIFVAKLVPVPVDLLRIDAINWAVFGVLKVTALGELGSAVSAPLLRVDSCTRYENNEEMLKCDDFVLDVVFSCCNEIVQLCLKSCVKKLEMFLSFGVFFMVEGFGEFSPAMDKWAEWGLEDESFKTWSHTWRALLDASTKKLRRWTNQGSLSRL